MKYYYSDKWTVKAREIAKAIGFEHVKAERIAVIVGQGSKSKRTIARVHGLAKAMMLGMGEKYSFYTIELIEQNFEKESDEEKLKTIIHELMHIPKAFGGGFLGHKGWITKSNINILYKKYVEYESNKQNKLDF